MGSLYRREDRYDEFTRLEQAIKSNKRYLLELNKNGYQKKIGDIYSALIKNQELLLRALSE
jgi:hypothetical protein